MREKGAFTASGPPSDPWGVTRKHHVRGLSHVGSQLWVKAGLTGETDSHAVRRMAQCETNCVSTLLRLSCLLLSFLL